MPGTIVKDALLQGNTNINGTVYVAPGTQVSGLNKRHVGLNNVDNTRDIAKQMSNKTKEYIDYKVATSSIPN